LTFGSRPTPEFADLTVQDCLAPAAETRISLNFRAHYALMPLLGGVAFVRDGEKISARSSARISLRPQQAVDGRRCRGTLEFHNLFATGETGKRIMEKTGLKLTVLKGGSYGGDMELGADCQREIGFT